MILFTVVAVVASCPDLIVVASCPDLIAVVTEP